MFGLFDESFRYDSTLRKSQDPHKGSWRREGKRIVFGPEYAAAVLDQEQNFVNRGYTKESAALAEWIVGLSGEELRKNFPEAVTDAEPFRKIRERTEPFRSSPR